MDSPIEIIIANGQIADDANGALVKRDIGIALDRVVAITEPGQLLDRPSPARVNGAPHVLDASGCVVSPGFIDIHSHSDTFPLIDPSARSKLCDGVTTEIAGNCGSSPFPLRGNELILERQRVDRYGLPIDWTQAGEFFERAECTGTAINRAYLVGHGTVRAAVMGHENRQPSKAELAAMRQEVDRAMEAGAFGLSSGLIYPPGCFSKAEEITELCRSVAERSGLYSTHMRSESDDLETAVEEALHVAAESHVRLQISHIKTSGRRNWGKIAWLKERLTQAKDQGLDFACDRYPYTAASTGLHFVLPDWAKEGGAQAERERLTSPPIRKDIADAVASKYTDPGTWQRIVVSFVPSAGNKPYEGKSISDVAQLMGCDPITAVFNLLVAENLNVDAIIFSMCEENLREILTWPFVAIGSDAAFRCTDGPLSEGKPHPRAYGTFSRILARYVAKEHVLTLPEAIRRMTLLPAQRVGLPERGAIKKGWHADLVVFDPAAIEDRATYEQPHQYSTGIRYVLVNGKIALRDGVPSGGLHGRILRKR